MTANDTTELQEIIDAAWEDRASLKPGTAPAKIGDAVTHVLNELDAGTLRVAERVPGTQQWTTHQWPRPRRTFTTGATRRWARCSRTRRTTWAASRA